MGRIIRGVYYEDDYVKHECQACRRSFIVGAMLSKDRDLSCPYCGTRKLEIVAAATADATEYMDMGCMELYYSLYDDGSLTLYTEREFAAAMTDAMKKDYKHGVPMGAVLDCVTKYCEFRDGRSS